MPKQAISVSLEAGNLAWLRGRAIAAGRRSVSELLDDLIHSARDGGPGAGALMRSVVGTIGIDAGDPELKKADRRLRALLGRSLRRRARGTRARRG
jgi:hypothetical protein